MSLLHLRSSANVSPLCSGRQGGVNSQGGPVTHQAPENRKKSFHHKSFHGCSTCKKRKVKCDEGKPECLRCTRTSRSCQYSPPKPLLFEVWDKSRFESQHNAYALKSYVERSAQHFAGPWDTGDFWTIFGPEASHVHPAVYHALIGLGCLHERYLAELDPNVSAAQSEGLHVRGIQQYNKAIQSLVATNGSDIPIEVILACCVLFWSFEVLLTNGVFNICHAESGFKILRDLYYPEQVVRNLRLARRKSSPVVEETLTPVFTRIGIILSAFCDDFPPVDDEWFTDDCAMMFRIDIPHLFSDTDTAYEKVDQTLKRLFRATALPSSPNKVIAFEDLQARLLPELGSALSNSLTLPSSATQASHIRQTSHLRIHHRVATVMQNSLTSLDEMIFDRYSDDFQLIVTKSRALLHSNLGSHSNFDLRFCHPHPPESAVSLGFIPPLFFTATRCRDPSIRHDALGVLHDLLHHEQIWSSCTAYQIAKWIVETEEGDMEGDISMTVPIHRRIRLVGVELNSVTKSMILTFQHPSQESNTAEKTVALPWRPESDNHGRDDSQSFSIPKKVVRVAGYAGTLLRCRSVTCHCIENR